MEKHLAASVTGTYRRGLRRPDRALSGRRLLLPPLVAVLVLVTILVPRVNAAVLSVDAATDAGDASAGDGFCDDGSGNCTLRAAIEEANALAGPDTIVLTLPGPYILALGQLDVTSALTVTSDSGGVISGGGSSRVFYVSGTGNLSLQGLTIQDGVDSAGGGILIDWGGQANILDCAIVDNVATTNGGGICNTWGTLNIANSTISGNQAGGNGGGIHQLGFSGIGIANLTHVTIRDNRSDLDDSGGGDGGGTYVLSSASTFRIRNTLVAGNRVGASGDASEPDCYSAGGLESLGYNLIGGSSSLPPGTPNANDDFVGTPGSPLDPILGPLSGSPSYYPLLASSLAIDPIPLASATYLSSANNPLFSDGDLVSADERGAPRACGPGLGGSAWDIGAYEYDSSITAVDLLSFTAAPEGAAIRLDWETASEIDNVGFNLYRSDVAEGSYVLLNQGLIPSQSPGAFAGAVYTWLDKDVVPGATYYYKLEDVDAHGVSTLHDPVWVTLDKPPTHVIYLPMVTNRAE